MGIFVYSNRITMPYLFHTDEETTLQKTRWITPNEPFTVANLTRSDLSPNSPNEKKRLTDNAEVIRLNPNADRYDPVLPNGYFDNTVVDTYALGLRLKDCAFVWVMTGDTRYRDAAKTGLLNQIRLAKTNFAGTSFRDNFGPNAGSFQIDGNPLFSICEWAGRLEMCYDYLKESFTTAERTECLTWFKNAALFFQRNLDNELGTFFTDRFAQNYTLRRNTGYTAKTTHIGGYTIPAIGPVFNNRKFVMAKLFAMTTILLNDGDPTNLTRSARRFVEEWLRFSVFPDGTQAEMERSFNNQFEEQGWSYGMSCITIALQIADLFARHKSDRSLYEYTTNQGWLNTIPSSGVKDLWTVIKCTLGYLDGTLSRYAIQVGNEVYKIDGIDEETKWYTVQDTSFASISNYYYLTKTTTEDKNYIKLHYTRKYPGSKPLPVNAANGGPWPGWCTPSGQTPSHLFQYAFFEGLTDPYGVTVVTETPDLLKIEAETGYTKIVDVDGDIGTNANPERSGGLDLKIWDIGDKISYNFNSTPNEFTIKVKARCGNSVNSSAFRDSYRFTVNGVEVKGRLDMSSIGSLEATYGGSYWGTYILDKFISKDGVNTLTIEALSTFLGVDFIEVVKTLAPNPPKYTIDQLISIANIQGSTPINTIDQLFSVVKLNTAQVVLNQIAQTPFQITFEGVILRGQPQVPVSNTFTYTLDSPLNTSAGIFSSDGTLIRTLWSGERKIAGNYSYTWDGKDDEGATVTAGNYTAKVTVNDIQSTWEKVAGNTSVRANGDKTKLNRGLDPISEMVCVGSKNYYCVGDAEGSPATYYTTQANPHDRITVFPSKFVGPPRTHHICTDGRVVFWGGQDAYTETNTFIYASKVSDDTKNTFSSGQAANLRYGENNLYNFIAYKSLVNSEITGMAAQNLGTYLFVSRGGLNLLSVYNAVTGALVSESTSYINPGAITLESNTTLWMVVSGVIKKFTINSNGSLTDTGVSISGLEPQHLSHDGTNLLVCSNSTSQVKAYNSSGTLVWTLGTSGGYSTSSDVTNTKFYWKDLRGTRKAYTATQSDGKLWVGDGGNYRNLRFTTDRSAVDNTIMFLPRFYNMGVDKNDTKRVFGDTLEFEIDYNNTSYKDSWTLKRNWGYNMVSGDYDQLSGLITPTTLSNGRTYCLLPKNGNKSDLSIHELVTGGNLRPSVTSGINNGPKIYKDGTLRFSQTSGSTTVFRKYTITGFTGANNPTLSAVTTYATSTDSSVINAGPFQNQGEVLSNGLMLLFEANKETGWHGAAMDPITGKFKFKFAKSTATTYTGDYPLTDYDIGNRITLEQGGGPGTYSMALEDFLFWHYYGEFWKGAGGQVNKFNMLSKDGLFLIQFGVARNPSVTNLDPLDGMAGNAFAPHVVRVGDVIYMYHQDESFWGGLHRWKITNFSSVRTIEKAVKI